MPVALHSIQFHPEAAGDTIVSLHRNKQQQSRLLCMREDVLQRLAVQTPNVSDFAGGSVGVGNPVVVFRDG